MSRFGVTQTIARQQWLNPVEKGLQTGVQKVFGSMGERGHRVEDILHGTWLGHPLHVVLTDIPIGSWTSAMIFDVLDLTTGRRDFRKAADACIGIGIAGAVGSALTGLADWQAVDPPARRIGLVHALLNTAALALQTTALAARNKSRTRRRVLSMAGFAVATVSARLGGNLVYEQKIGVDHTAGQNFPEEFVAIIDESELSEGKLIRADYSGTPILLLRRGGEIFAIAETCSHLGGPLSEGQLLDNRVQCPWHGSEFSLEDGRVLNGPAVHPVPCMDTRIHNGKVEIRKRTLKSARALKPSRPSVVEMPRTGTEG